MKREGKKQHGSFRRWFNVVILGRRYHSQCKECWRRGVVHQTASTAEDTGWWCGKHAPKMTISCWQGNVEFTGTVRAGDSNRGRISDDVEK